MRVVQINKEDWAKVSEDAHLVVFSEVKRSDTDRIDFALMVENREGFPMFYATCRELDSTSMYFQYGGSFPGTKDTVYSLRAFQAILRWVKEHGYERIGYFVQNDNLAMLKLAMKTGFKITGVRNFKGHILLEHILEFGNG